MLLSKEDDKSVLMLSTFNNEVKRECECGNLLCFMDSSYNVSKLLFIFVDVIIKI